MKLLESSTGKWEEERLLIWWLLKELQEAQQEEKLLRKKQSDAAHEKIRALQSLKWKMWTSLITALAVVVVEVLKLLFARH